MLKQAEGNPGFQVTTCHIEGPSGRVVARAEQPAITRILEYFFRKLKILILIL